MMKDIIKKRQPIVYQILKNALNNHRLAHAYLFYGPNGSLKQETAILLAQSIICKGDDFACESCNNCLRIAKNEYSDVIYIDARNKAMRKDDVIKIQQIFAKTALEKQGKKIYIIHAIENASVESLNSLLKFVEEPSDDTYAIFISAHLERVLPTIVSRCQCIPFKAMSFEWSYDEGKTMLDAFDNYLCAKLIHNPNKALSLIEDEAYQHARYVFLEMGKKYLDDPDEALFFIQTQGYPNKGKLTNKASVGYFLDMMLVIYQDCLRQSTSCEDKEYLAIYHQLLKEDCVKVIDAIMNAKDLLFRSMNIPLLIDQLFYKMKEGKL